MQQALNLIKHLEYCKTCGYTFCRKREVGSATRVLCDKAEMARSCDSGAL